MSNVAKSTAAFRSLSRAMFRGFVRDRTALIFSILIPVLFLVLLRLDLQEPDHPAGQRHRGRPGRPDPTRRRRPGS